MTILPTVVERSGSNRLVNLYKLFLNPIRYYYISGTLQ